MSATDETSTEQPTPPVTEQPAATPPASIDPNETPEAKATRERDDVVRTRRSTQERINEAVRKQREQERETAYWRGRAEAAKPAAAAQATKTKPTPDQFDDYGAFVEALTDWKADEKITAKLSERDQSATKATIEETRSSNWSRGVEAAKQAHPDYDDVMAVSDVPIADHVKELLLDSEHGPRLAYHLDQHPDVADRLNALTPTQAARELGRIEAMFMSATPTQEDSAVTETEGTPAAKPTAPAPVKPRTTSAPAPAKPAGQGRSAAIPLEKQSMEEYVATRKTQGAGWAR
jgi:hypothetical protein